MNTISMIYQALSFGFRPIILNGKTKFPLLKNWPAPLDDDEIITLGRKVNNNNVGILCGIPSKIIVIDVDIQNGGLQNWENIVLDEEIFIKTPIVQTPSGGFHYYFEYEDLDVKSNLYRGDIKIGGIDILKDGRQCVYPGSVYSGCGERHKCGGNNEVCNFRGKNYFWYKSPIENPISKFPIELKKYLRSNNKKHG